MSRKTSKASKAPQDHVSQVKKKVRQGFGSKSDTGSSQESELSGKAPEQTTIEAVDIESVWEAPTPRTFSTEHRQLMLNRYLPLVRNVAARLAMGFPRSVDLTDLVNTGVIGLIEAFKNYNPKLGVTFETYAVPKIRGAMLDELRHLDWMPRASRSSAPDRRYDTTTALQLASRHLDESVDSIPMEAISIAIDQIDLTEKRVIVSQALRALDEQELLIITLYYFEEMTLAEISNILGISESACSVRHTRAVVKLRQLVKSAEIKAILHEQGIEQNDEPELRILLDLSERFAFEVKTALDLSDKSASRVDDLLASANFRLEGKSGNV